METAWMLVVIGGTTLIFNVCMHFFGGGWKLAGRLSSIEVTMASVGEDLKALRNVLVDLANMRGDYRVLDQRLLAVEKHVDELRHGDGFVRNRSLSDPGINREYPPAGAAG